MKPKFVSQFVTAKHDQFLKSFNLSSFQGSLEFFLYHDTKKLLPLTLSDNGNKSSLWLVIFNTQNHCLYVIYLLLCEMF